MYKSWHLSNLIPFINVAYIIASEAISSTMLPRNTSYRCFSQMLLLCFVENNNKHKFTWILPQIIIYFLIMLNTLFGILYHKQNKTTSNYVSFWNLQNYYISRMSFLFSIDHTPKVNGIEKWGPICRTRTTVSFVQEMSISSLAWLKTMDVTKSLGNKRGRP